jgi:hypothetical protein
MNTYTVLYRIESIMGPLDAPFGFVCHADDADHAEEQCLNAYPDCAPVWCAQGDDYPAALEEYWTTTEGGAE